MMMKNLLILNANCKIESVIWKLAKYVKIYKRYKTKTLTLDLLKVSNITLFFSSVLKETKRWSGSNPAD